MPSAEHSRTIAAPFADVWAFVADMDNWAPLVTGYQRHEKLSDAESFWFLKGELGGLTRVAEFKVHIDEWDESGRVRFSLQGVNEPVTGSGSFVAEAITPDEDEPSGGMPEPAQPGPLTRFRNRISRWLLSILFRRPPGSAPVATVRPASAGQCRIHFALTLQAGGGAGMVLNMLMAPMMLPVAEDLANRIAETIERSGAG
jgi:carbon monoxide dehydrogenase subunit G